jgi:23S rRNA (adenine2030-N6)-methyltransferase
MAGSLVPQETRLNYRHAFHAGNFADLVKHAVLLDLLGRLTGEPGPLTVIDTHAGGGIYDLVGAEARRSGEAEAGIGRLMRTADAPPVFAALKSAVTRLSADGRLYPGSPYLAAQALRPKDSYVGFELRDDDFGALKQALRAFSNAGPVRADGYASAAARTPRSPAKVLMLIDPPFERPDDYGRVVDTIAAVRSVNAGAVIAVWLPIKDLETLDAFQRRVEALRLPGFMAEARIRPLDDPMKMNGCAMLVLGDPAARSAAEAAAQWVVEALGQPGGKAVVSDL